MSILISVSGHKVGARTPRDMYPLSTRAGVTLRVPGRGPWVDVRGTIVRKPIAISKLARRHRRERPPADICPSSRGHVPSAGIPTRSCDSGTCHGHQGEGRCPQEGDRYLNNAMKIDISQNTPPHSTDTSISGEQWRIYRGPSRLRPLFGRRTDAVTYDHVS